METSSLEDLTQQLRDRHSAVRRKAAKTLRVLANPAAADALMFALRREITDRRTWETQYQLVMAVGSCCTYQAASVLLEAISTGDLEPMVHLAAGDALVRLAPDVDTAIKSTLASGSVPRAEGAIRALTMNRLTPSSSTIRAILQYAQGSGHEQVRFWVAAAAAGWPKDLVETFLSECLSNSSAETRRAAQASREGRFLRWNPL